MDISKKDTAILVTTDTQNDFLSEKGVTRKVLFLASAVILGLVLTSASMADARGGGQEAFVGLWQAIDSFDGST